MNTTSEREQFEKIRTIICASPDEACNRVADRIATLIQERDRAGKRTVLGLATGSTPIRLYRELIRRHREEGLSFKSVTTFNLDEYYPISPTARQSYVRFMKEQLFDHIDIDQKQTHIPNGELPREEIFKACNEYEEKIRAAGGIDLQILGIGRTGHIGFNEPGSKIDSRTRMVTLDGLTRKDAAKDFGGESLVPRRAITMGVGTILAAREIVLMAWGESKAEILARAVEGDVSDYIPATFLQGHPNITFYIDEPAAGMLTRNRTPWLVGSCDWNQRQIRKAVVMLSQQVKKPLLKLQEKDYNEHGLGDLVTVHGPAYDININVFNQLQHTITGWPGGKKDADDTYRPERAKPFPKKSVIFSPETDNAVLSMGGTLHRLIQQGHDVSVVFLTSGYLSVNRDETIRFVEFLKENGASGIDQKELDALILNEDEEFFESSPLAIRIRQAVSQGEARAVCRFLGIPSDRVHFLNMPFYETGCSRKNSLNGTDIELVENILQQLQPDQVYLSGNISDPNGTSRLAFESIQKAIAKLNTDLSKKCYFWLYQGENQEWEVDQIDMAVPLSPDELNRKMAAVLKYQSQRNQQGGGQRASWEIIRNRNQATARLYDELGLAEYEAIEVFKRWIP
jgi:glucosamine-6-phosphate deaminase